ncbi:TrkA family potassium uptake protein [Cyclobacteriaceae bacterium]|nr:TrkA family potassium uptake protein [Cyclobacteriaceae bacterium]
MNDKFAVIGLGLLGTGIAKALANRGAEVLAIDNDEEKIEDIKDDVAHAVEMDSTDERALRAQNLQDFDAVVVAIGHNFEGLLLTTVLLNEIGVKRIITRISSPHQRMILEKIGITEMFSPDEEVGKTVAEKLIHPEVKSFLPLPDDYEIIEINTPKRVSNKSIHEVALRERYNLNLITIKRQFQEEVNGEISVVEHIIGVPKSDTVLLESDVIILLGKSYDVDRFVEMNK